MLMSLKPDRVRIAKGLRPDWPCGVLMSVSVGDIQAMDADFLAVNAKLATRSFVERAHKAGKENLRVDGKRRSHDVHDDESGRGRNPHRPPGAGRRGPRDAAKDVQFPTIIDGNRRIARCRTRKSVSLNVRLCGPSTVGIRKGYWYSERVPPTRF